MNAINNVAACAVSARAEAKYRPILFSGAMVRALLDGSKTQTRRVAIKTSQPDVVVGVDFDFVECKLEIENRKSGERYWKPCPYGVPGDRLWVRETWAYHVMAMASVRDELGPWVYAADGSIAQQARLCDRWRPSIHMPRAASRITLEITRVRVERLQDISEADAQAEGIRETTPPLRNFRLEYADLWESINGPGAWDANPWVWVVEFKRIDSQISL